MVIILKVIELMKIISTIVCDRDGCYLVLPLFSGWLNGWISRQIEFLPELVHLFEICYNPHENSKYVLILKNEKHLDMSLSEWMLQWNPSKENISFINKLLRLSRVWSHFFDSMKGRFSVEVVRLWDIFPERRPWDLPMPCSSDKPRFSRSSTVSTVLKIPLCKFWHSLENW